MALAPEKMVLCRTPQRCFLLKATRSHHPLSSLLSLHQETSSQELAPLCTIVKSLALPPSPPPAAPAQLCPHQHVYTHTIKSRVFFPSLLNGIFRSMGFSQHCKLHLNAEGKGSFSFPHQQYNTGGAGLFISAAMKSPSNSVAVLFVSHVIAHARLLPCTSLTTERVRIAASYFIWLLPVCARTRLCSH